MRKLITMFLSVLLVFGSFITAGISQSVAQVGAESKYEVLEDFEDNPEWIGQGARFNSINVSPTDSKSRFGNWSLKIDYDFLGTEGVSGVYAQPKEEIRVPKGTKKIGLWIYGDGAGHWLRFQMEDAAGNDFNIDLTEEQPNGVNWEGWKYVEAEIPSAWEAPFKINKNGIRYMATKDNMKNKGTIYIDKIIALFDDIDEDVVNPEVVSKIPNNNSVIETSKPLLEIDVKDSESGIDYASTLLRIDNKDVEYKVKDGKIIYQVVSSLADGLHQVYIEIFDKAGNHYFETWNFKVDSGNFSLNWSEVKDSIAGDSSDISIIVNNLREVNEFSFELETSDHVKNLKLNISDKFKGNYKYEQGRHSFHGLEGLEIDKETLAQFKYSLDPNASGDLFIKVKNASYSIGNEKNIKFYLEDYKSKIIQPLRLSIEGISVGTPSEIRVVDLDEKVVDGARLRILDNYKLIKFKEDGKVYKSTGDEIVGEDYLDKKQGEIVVVAKDFSNKFPYYRVFIENGEQRYYHVHKDVVEEVEWNELLDEVTVNGKLTTSMLTLSQIPLKIQAYKGKLVSQVIELQIAPQLGSENAENILVTWSDEIEESMHLSWKTDTKERKTMVRYKESNLRSPWSEVTGESRLIADASGEIRVHHADLTGLKPGTKYDFILGDGSVWSEVQSYTTPKPKNQDSNTFTLVADSQAYDEAGFSLYLDIVNLAKKRNANTQFVLHAGDIVEEGNRLEQWDMFLKYQSKTNLPLISVMGNHDVYGNGTDTYNRLITNPQNGPKGYENTVYYQDFGDARIIVLNSEVGRKGMEDQVEWLKNTIKSNEKQWTIVSFHRSPYKANPKRPDDVTMEVFAPVIEEMGVDLVLTGHDHSYLRTYPMDKGKTSDKGTVYLIAGSSGPKFYPSENQAYAELAYFEEKQVASNITISKEAIIVEAFNSEEKVIDSFKIEKEYNLSDLEKSVQRLESLIERVEQIESSKYTKDTYTKLMSKLELVKEALLVAEITSVNSAYDELLKALESLVEVEKENGDYDQGSHPEENTDDSDAPQGNDVIPQTGMSAPILGGLGISLMILGIITKFMMRKE